MNTFTTRTTICALCDRKFSGRDVKMVNKLLDLHTKKTHNQHIDSSKFLTIEHKKTPDYIKLSV